MDGLVIQRNGKVLTTTLLIAEKFGKDHKHVMDSVRAILAAENSAVKKMFATTNHVNRGKKYPMFVMNRDGFSLLVMGFTGSKALEFKLKFIEAFNKMEEELRNQSLACLPNFNDPAEAARAWADQFEQRSLAEANLSKATETIQIQAPKVRYHDEVLASKGAHVITSIAKELGMSGKSLNALLRDHKIQYVCDGRWVLYGKYQDKGYTKTRTYKYVDEYGVEKTAMNTVWTEAGRRFIHDFINSLRS